MPAFELVAKSLQAQFRDESPTISPEARNPLDIKGKRNPHLLALGHEDDNLIPSIRGPHGAREFFHERGIKWWKAPQSGDNKEVDGPTRNMASSQICCINYLLPLTRMPNTLVTMLNYLDADVAKVAPVVYDIDGAAFSSLVEFEWVGLGSTLEGTSPQNRGAFATSSDALLLADLKSGGRRAYLIEWKYVEKYTTDKFLGRGSQGQTRFKRYSHLYDSSSSPFDRRIPLDEWMYKPLYQLMRLMLLCQRMIDHNELGVTECRVVAVCPQENTEYRNRITSPELGARFPACNTLEEVIHSSIGDSSRFCMASQIELLQAVGSSQEAHIQSWLAYHKDRYGWA